MTTQTQLVGPSPVDLAAALGLTVGEIVAIARIGSAPARITVGPTSAPDDDDGYVPVRVEPITLQIGSDPVWAWCQEGQTTRISVTTLRAELGPLRDRAAVDVSTDDFEHAAGFILQVGGAGTVEYRTLDGDTDITETFGAAGVVSVGGVPVLLRAVRTGSAAPNLVAGLL